MSKKNKDKGHNQAEAIQPDTSGNPILEKEHVPKTLKVAIRKVTVMLAPYSHAYKLLTARQFKEKAVKKLGNIALGERVFEPGKPYEVELTNEVLAAIKKGVFQVIRNTIYGRPKN